ncbi:hypothetical protein P5V15_000030 [Pogonomyrmex californicus]
MVRLEYSMDQRRGTVKYGSREKATIISREDNAIRSTDRLIFISDCILRSYKIAKMLGELIKMRLGCLVADWNFIIFLLLYYQVPIASRVNQTCNVCTFTSRERNLQETDNVK